VKTSISLILFLMGTSTFVFGQSFPNVPEIDGNSAAAAVTLIAGGLLVMRARRKK